jgi:hypothetical protein
MTTCHLDEFGNNGFDFSKPGVSSHFIVCGVVAKEEDTPSLQSLGDSIANSYFGGSEIKSSKVASDDGRRIQILGEILGNPFHIYCMIFDKTVMFGKGLHRKKSFYKFLNKTAYANLTQSLGAVRLVADEVGDRAFMVGFETYVNRHIQANDLFQESQFQFVASHLSRPVQLADFLAGSLARCFDTSVLSPNREHILDLLFRSGQLLPIYEWPARRSRYTEPVNEPPLDPLDAQVLKLSVRKANQFITYNADRATDFSPEQVAAVKVLLYHAQYGNPEKYISTGTFLRYFSSNPLLNVSSKQFGRSIIGPLRDAGVLISSNKSGYKLIVAVADLRQFVRYYHLFLAPMLHRMKKYRDMVSLATLNKLDILHAREYDYLRRFLDANYL